MSAHRSAAARAAAGTRPLGVVAIAVTIAIACAVLAGCLSGGFHSNQPTQQEYLLRWAGTSAAPAASPPEATSALAADRTLEVLLPTSSPGLEGDGIAVLRAGERLDYYSGARWAAPAPQMLQGLAVEALRAGGRFSWVEGDGAPFAADWVLEVELAHFEAQYEDAGPPTVRVGLVCTLGQRGARRAVASIAVQAQAMASADRMGEVVDAFQRATREALSQAASRLAPTPAPAQVPGPASVR
jgi:cholesterol transport system auxiliary component